MSDTDLEKVIIREIAKPLLSESQFYKSVDHVVRSLDSTLYAMESEGLLSADNLRYLIEFLGGRYAPYIVLISKYKDEIESRKVRFKFVTHYLHLIEEYARTYEAQGYKPPNLPLGFTRPPPDMLEPKIKPPVKIRVMGGYGGRSRKLKKALIITIATLTILALVLVAIPK